MSVNPVIDQSWKDALSNEFAHPYFAELKQFLLTEKQKHPIYPPGNYIFNAFNQTPFHNVRVVVIGQDPYHGHGQAHGLSFSVPKGVPIPPSLQNIYKEIYSDLGLPIPSHGNLETWAQQGVLLLNATLTVRANQAGSHQGKGWERFTDAAIIELSNHRDNLIFMLWGSFAQAKSKLINSNKHHILTAPHPSPLSAYRGFFGCRHFSKANQILQNLGQRTINWEVPD